jgi:hypothetical protein
MGVILLIGERPGLPTAESFSACAIDDGGKDQLLHVENRRPKFIAPPKSPSYLDRAFRSFRRSSAGQPETESAYFSGCLSKACLHAAQQK